MKFKGEFKMRHKRVKYRKDPEGPKRAIFGAAAAGVLLVPLAIYAETLKTRNERILAFQAEGYSVTGQHPDDSDIFLLGKEGRIFTGVARGGGYLSEPTITVHHGIVNSK